ncbi:MAG: NAD-glutamate dehydrogenase [Pseudomonadota bacterium]
MPLTAKDQANTLIQQAENHILEKFNFSDAELLQSFTRHFYHDMHPEDVLARGDTTDLYGVAADYWQYIRQHKPGSPSIRAYNPVFEQHGWQSTHTIVTLITQDVPFLVDSVRMALNRAGAVVHLIHPLALPVQRDDGGHITSIGKASENSNNHGYKLEAIIHVEVDRQTGTERLADLRKALIETLRDLQVAVDDWQPMNKRLDEIIHELKTTPPPLDNQEIGETIEFLSWLRDRHFTLLGYREYNLSGEEDNTQLNSVTASGLGILRKEKEENTSRSFSQLPANLKQKAHEPKLLLLTKANAMATVHHPARLDYVGIKRIDSQGKVTGEHRFLGLYTSSVYHSSIANIPLIRTKLKHVLAQAGYDPEGHRGKAVANVLESYPRDEIFQTEPSLLHEFTIGILQLQERQRLRLFVRPDDYGRFFSCMVFVPRERYDSDVRQRMQNVLLEAFSGHSVEFNVMLSQTAHAQVHFVVRTATGSRPDYDVKALEAELTEIARDWTDILYDALIEHCGEELGVQRYQRYESAFPIAYKADYSARQAAYDIDRIENLAEQGGLDINLYRPVELLDGTMRFKLFHIDYHLPLSDVLPILENMGVEVLDERAYEIQGAGNAPVWIQEFGLRQQASSNIELSGLQNIFKDVFTRAWRGELENDGFNRLVLNTHLKWRDIVILRAYWKYLRQAGSSFSQTYIENTLTSNPDIVRALLDLFYARFCPETHDATPILVDKIHTLLEAVNSLDEDRILRRFMAVIQATLRTNYFQCGDDAQPKPYVSFKLNPSQIPEMPDPKPVYEIFVYSPRMEGVHLRGGKVARGGLRWSDRFEDFRTEILGLVKAQIVKNAVIVPVGSKGGFVAKRLPTDGDREAFQAEGIACYRTFMRGLLDLTDNLQKSGRLIPPLDVVRHDEDDPYLVVAADKGTATFSDIANEVAGQYGFWLGDAFASGGSAGYDHKKMGITARGAWESVKRHFRELGKNIQQEDFTVVGIGDMGGDVFGNGMLLSPHIKLVAAFNHMHIFLDPNPDTTQSFGERQRMFQLPRSTWQDYNADLISAGGGIFSRAQKSIPLSSEVKAMLDIKVDSVTPVELIRAILCAPVDLLWNGGIGTYVKASHQHNDNVGDRANDAVRIDARDLHCKVVGEGGNLGLTQQGRIEYAMRGGRINTDAIDNAGGVNCSDHEVNIKIALNAVVANEDMTGKQRDQLLLDMTDSVAELVIRDNYLQTQALSISTFLSSSLLDVHARFIRYLERDGKLDRALEDLPDEEAIGERRTSNIGLTAPEIAVVISYSKITLFEQLIDSDLPDDPYFSTLLEEYFPAPLPERFSTEIAHHRLRREIIATSLTNTVVNRGSATFVFTLSEETSLPAAGIVRAFLIAWRVFDMQNLWDTMESLDNQVEALAQLSMMVEAGRMVERAARWLLRNRKAPLSIAETIGWYAPAAAQLQHALPELIAEDELEALQTTADSLTNIGIPEALAQQIAGLPTWLSALDIVDVADAAQVELFSVARLHFMLGSELKLHWLRDQISDLPKDNRWQALSRSALRDELLRTHRELTTVILQYANSNELNPESTTALFDAWMAKEKSSVDNCLGVLTELSNIDSPDLSMLSVALRDIRNLL